MTDKELEEFIYVGENKFIELAMIFGDAWPSKAIQIAAEYKALLAKEWVGLTDKEVVILAYQSQENECTAIRLAEQALKEKNA